ncbi:unnamed protein product [Macrosiphum euphorbiae]|uniref:RNase H type-1 domain-containing protein n=2 Tax=Macrosiphum euphorbiae TaxID=13131 RepID=A0AAV0XG45_9HEMI|nr:unnamed protein product [Macrosiphum euphorbiae]
MTQLNFSENLRILGLTFDHKLSWKTHIKKLKTSCMGRMNIIKTLSNLSWGSDQNSLILIYKSLILSLMNYGSVIYGTAKATTLSSLDPIHNQGIRLATGSFKTSPVASILCNAGEPPLQIIRDSNTIKYMIKISNQPKHISFSNFHQNFPYTKAKTPTTIFENFNRIKKNINLNIDLTKKSLFPIQAPWTWSPDINTDLLKYNKNTTANSSIVALFYESVEFLYYDYTLIYTDASKSINGTGFAIVDGQQAKTFRLPSFSSIFTAESYALYMAVQFVVQSDYKYSLIISDSLSALISLQDHHPQNEVIQLTKDLISSSKNKIKFMWVPSHIGIPGNEKADKMANEAVTSTTSTIINKIPSKDLLNEAHKRIIKTWQNHWDSIPSSNKLRNIKKSISKWAYPENASRREQIVINRSRIGHSHITHSYLITKETPPLCDTCKTPLTMAHIIIVCPKFSTARFLLNNPRSIEEALSQQNSDNIFKFFKKIELDKKL